MAPKEEDHLSFFAARLGFDPGAVNDQGEVSAKCPFHDDSTQSLSVNVKTGLWHCFAAQCAKTGNRQIFEKMLKEGPGSVDLDPSLVKSYHQVLLSSRPVLEWLEEKRGIKLDVVKKYNLGYDSERIWIPVYDADKKLVNVRKYNRKATSGRKMISVSGHGSSRLYPADTIEDDWVLLLEGEWDCFLAIQLGYPAVTTTGGAGSWKREFNSYFRQKHVIICYDNDKAGETGAVKAAASLLAVAKSIKVIKLPFDEPKGADFTDFFMHHKNTKEDFDRLIQEAPFFIAKGPAGRIIDDKISVIQLADSGHERHTYTRVEMLLHVAGKDLAPYLAPKRVGFSCEMGRPECKFCSIAAAGGVLQFEFTETHVEILETIGAPKAQVEGIVRRAAGVVQKCPKPHIEVESHHNIEAIRAIPDLDSNYDQDEEQYTMRPLFFLGHGLALNSSYKVTGLCLPDPRNQSATVLVYKAEARQDSIERYVPKKESLSSRSVFEV